MTLLHTRTVIVAPQPLNITTINIDVIAGAGVNDVFKILDASGRIFFEGLNFCVEQVVAGATDWNLGIFGVNGEELTPSLSKWYSAEPVDMTVVTGKFKQVHRKDVANWKTPVGVAVANELKIDVNVALSRSYIVGLQAKSKVTVTVEKAGLIWAHFAHSQ